MNPKFAAPPLALTPALTAYNFSLLQGRGADDGRHQRAESRHRDRVWVLGVQEERLVIQPPAFSASTRAYRCYSEC